MLSKQEIDSIIDLMASPEKLPISVNKRQNGVQISTLLNLRGIIPESKYLRDGELWTVPSGDTTRLIVEGKDLNTLTLKLWDKVRLTLRNYYRDNTKD